MEVHIMKNRIFRLSALSIVFALIVTIFSTAVCAQSNYAPYVYDPAYLLDDAQYMELNQLAAETSEKHGCAVHFVITDDPALNLYNIQQYSEDLYLYSPDFGYGDGKDGVMLVLGTYDRCYWLLAYGEKGNAAFTDYAKDRIADNFLDNFADNDWYGGFKDYITDCDYMLSEAAAGKPVDVYYDDTYYEKSNIGVEAYGFALIAGIVIALITCVVFSSQMKTAKMATGALDYVDRSGVAITNRHNLFKFSTVTRTEIKTSSSSHGGTTINSRGFSGRGGRF